MSNTTYNETEQEAFNSTFNSTSPPVGPATTKISVFTPLIYVAIVLSALVMFSKVYRRRNLKKLSHTKPFFPPNIPKEIYYELVSRDPKPNDKVIKAALFRWASELIRRTLKLKECEQAITKMYQNGIIGDELFTRYIFAKKLEELELQTIAQEAEGIKKGWAAAFFPLIQEITPNEALARRVEGLGKLVDEQLDQWGYDQATVKRLGTRGRI